MEVLLYISLNNMLPFTSVAGLVTTTIKYHGYYTTLIATHPLCEAKSIDYSKRGIENYHVIY